MQQSVNDLRSLMHSRVLLSESQIAQKGGGGHLRSLVQPTPVTASYQLRLCPAALLKPGVTSCPDVICAALMDFSTIFYIFSTSSGLSHQHPTDTGNWGVAHCGICRKMGWAVPFCMSVIKSRAAFASSGCHTTALWFQNLIALKSAYRHTDTRIQYCLVLQMFCICIPYVQDMCIVSCNYNWTLFLFRQVFCAPEEKLIICFVAVGLHLSKLAIEPPRRIAIPSCEWLWSSST